MNQLNTEKKGTALDVFLYAGVETQNIITIDKKYVHVSRKWFATITHSSVIVTTDHTRT